MAWEWLSVHAKWNMVKHIEPGHPGPVSKKFGEESAIQMKFFKLNRG